jgi:hypothetical protein
MHQNILKTYELLFFLLNILSERLTDNMFICKEICYIFFHLDLIEIKRHSHYVWELRRTLPLLIPSQ